MGFNFLLADDESFFLTYPVLFICLEILCGCNSHDRAQRLNDRGVFNHVVSFDALRNFQTFCCLHNDACSGSKAYIARGKIIAFSAGFKFYTDNFYQFYDPLYFALFGIGPVSSRLNTCFTLTFTER